MENWENQLATEMNSGGFQLSIVAAFVGVGSVKYIIRTEKPNWDRVDYVCSLEEIKKLGEVLLDLYSFVSERLPVNDKGKLRELLSAKNIRDYSKLKKTVKISQ
jgi:hypothetical protein